MYHYRGIPKQYLRQYLKEIEFGFNNRNENIFEMLVKMLVKSWSNGQDIILQNTINYLILIIDFLV